MKNQRIFEFDEFEKNSNRNLFNSGYNFIIGTDEAGRGPGAGGVYAAAVCFLDKTYAQTSGAVLISSYGTERTITVERCKASYYSSIKYKINSK